MPMLLASDVYEIILNLSRKDLRGRSLSVEEYNSTARIVNETVFAKYYAEFENSSENSESLSGFKVLGESIPIVAGVGTLPASYYHVVGMPWYLSTGSVRRYLDLVSSLEHSKREQDYLTKATLIHPTFRFGLVDVAADMTIHVTPTTITPVYLDYIRTPDTPFLDYYIDRTTLVYTWMASGGGVVAIPAGSTARDGTTAGNTNSETVNWEFDSEDLPLIISLFLQHLGIQLPDNILYEGGTLVEQKIDKQ